MKNKQSDYYVYMLKNGAVKCGNPFDDLNNIDNKFSIFQTTADSHESAISEFLDNLELPQFMRDKIFKAEIYYKRIGSIYELPEIQKQFNIEV